MRSKCEILAFSYLERVKERINVFSSSKVRNKSNTVNSQDLLNANTFIVGIFSQKAHIVLKMSQWVSPGVR